MFSLRRFAGALSIALASGPLAGIAWPATVPSPRPTPEAPTQSQGSFGTEYWRSLYLRQFRFRTIRKLSGKSRVFAVTAVRPSVTPSAPTFLSLAPENIYTRLQGLDCSTQVPSNWWKVRRSRLKCDDGDDSYDHLCWEPPCRWTVSTDPYPIFRDFSYTDEFCNPLEIYTIWYRFQFDKRRTIDAISKNIEALDYGFELVFPSNSYKLSNTLLPGLPLGLSTTSSLHDFATYATFTKYSDDLRLLGEFWTPSTGTPEPAVSSSRPSSNPGYWWDTPGYGDIGFTARGKSARVAFASGSSWDGESSSFFDPDQISGEFPCVCPDSTSDRAPPTSPMNLTGFAVDSPDNCEIVCRGQFANIDLRTAGHGVRSFHVFFDVDQNRSTGCPDFNQQGAEYRAVLSVDGTQDPPQVSRALYRWTSGAWVPTPGILEDVRLAPCSARFTVDRASLGSPSGGLNVFAESYFQIGPNAPVLADVIPHEFYYYPIQVHAPDARTCPWVRHVNTTAIQNGFPSAPVEVEFSAPIDPPQNSDVTIVPPVAATVSAGASPRFLLITPTSAFPPGSYQCTLAPTIHDCAGHALSAGDSTSCGTPFTFYFCVPDTNMTTADGGGSAKEDFQVGEQVYLQASGETGLPGTIKAYLVDADVLDSPGRALIDQSDDGPTPVTASLGVISLTSLGAAKRPGDYAVVLDVNGDGIYETTDRTIDPCDGTVAVGSSCEDNLDAGVAAYWPLDESYPGAGALELEDGHDGFYVGNPVPQAGKVGGALGFDGSTNYVRVPNHPELEVGSDDFSLSGWVYPTAIGPINSIVDMRSFTRGYHVALTDGKLTGQLDDANGYANYQSSAVVPVGEWTHFVLSVARGSSTGLKIYLNGQLDSSHDPTAHAGDLTSGADLLIGGHSIAPTLGFAGALDEIVLWDSAMSAGDVSALYQAGLRGQACPDSARGTTAVAGGGAPTGPARVLRLSYPNPFRPGGRIQFTLAGRGRVRLGLFDAQGRRVAQLEDAVENQGVHSLTWDGRGVAGAQLPSGLYFVHLDSEAPGSPRTLILVR